MFPEERKGFFGGEKGLGNQHSITKQTRTWAKLCEIKSNVLRSAFIDSLCTSTGASFVKQPKITCKKLQKIQCMERRGNGTEIDLFHEKEKESFGQETAKNSGDLPPKS